MPGGRGAAPAAGGRRRWAAVVRVGGEGGGDQLFFASVSKDLLVSAPVPRVESANHVHFRSFSTLRNAKFSIIFKNCETIIFEAQKSKRAETSQDLQ